MRSNTRVAIVLLAASLAAGAALAVDGVYPPLTNWAAPATWSPHGARRGVSTMSDITNPLPFIATTPCRQYDSRAATPLLTNTSRAVVLTGAPCGLPTYAVAVSVNITVFNITGATGNGVFQVGTATAPTFAWINFPQTETQRGNAGALPLDASHQLWVRVQQGGGQLDFTVDVNGYYANSNSNADALPLGEGFNIYGTRDLSGVIFGKNFSDAGEGASGVQGQVTATDGQAAGVLGQARSFTGSAKGVWGESLSTATNTAGVFGRDNSGGPLGNFASSGVRGESAPHFGVLGVSRFDGVVGVLVSTAGAVVASGHLGVSFGTATDLTGPPWGVFASGNLGAFGAKHFVEPHPSDPKKVILYSSLEGREVGTYFRGTARVVNQQAVIEIPEDFRIVTDEEGLTVQLTPVGELATLAVISQDLSQIVVKASRDVTFHYLVQGVRRAFKDSQPVRIGYEFMPRLPTDTIPAYLTEEARRRLIANGTYNPDGTVNMETAERAGWAKSWAEEATPSGAKPQ